MTSSRHAKAPTAPCRDGLNAGRLGFDVGVGRTQAAIAAILQRRADGAGDRPVVVVPNRIIPTTSPDSRGERDAH